MNWTIGEVKGRGKETMRAGYWKCVLVALIMMVVGGGVGVAGNVPTNFNFNSNQNNNGFDFGGNIEYGSDDVISDLFDGYNDGYDQIESLMDEINASPYSGAIIGGIIGFLAIVWIISLLISIFLLTPLNVGCHRFYREAGERREYNVGSVAFAFSNNYLNVVKVMFLMTLKLFLWTLLLIIPGIIKTYEYRMIPYIIGENPGISSQEAFARSREMMSGHKWHSFLLDLSFIGWILLGVITFGILLLFYVNPYMACAQAELYLTLRGGARQTNANPYGGGTYSYNAYGQNTYNNGPYTGSPYDQGRNYPGGMDTPTNGGTYGHSTYGTDYTSTGNNGNAPTPGGNASNHDHGSYGHSSYDDNDTPAFGDRRNKPSENKDNPFNVPY